MKKVFFSVVLISIIGFCNTSFATSSVVGKITYMGTWVGVSSSTPQNQPWESDVSIKINAGYKNPANCTNGGNFYRLPRTASDFSRALLLSAKVSGKTVAIRVSADTCAAGWPQIVNVSFPN